MCILIIDPEKGIWNHKWHLSKWQSFYLMALQGKLFLIFEQ